MADKTPAERYFEFIEAELNQERAAVLGRYGRKVEEAIARCSALDPSDPDQLDAYREARRHVQKAISDLCLQREMLGLIDHSWVDRVYRIPPPA